MTTVNVLKFEHNTQLILAETCERICSTKQIGIMANIVDLIRFLLNGLLLHGYIMTTVNVLKLETVYTTLLYFFARIFKHLFHKRTDIMANSADNDQITPKEQSDLGLHCLHVPFCQKRNGI